MSRLKKLKQKIKDFFITNAFCRKIKIIFNGIIKIFIIRFILLVIAFLMVSLMVINLLKPQLVVQFKFSATKYFYSFLRLNRLNYSTINISGNARVTKEEIIEVIKNYNPDNLYLNSNQGVDFESNFNPHFQKLINEIKNKIPWIDKIVIKRTIPDIINIEVVEYQPFAIWINDSQKFIIDKDGNTIPFLPEYENSPEFNNMIILSGKGANKSAKSLFNILAINSSISQEIYSANWVGDRRWDIRFYDGLLVKLPEANIEKAWQDLIKLYEASKADKSIKSIDLRVGGKIYLKYDDKNNIHKIEHTKSIDS